MSNSMKLDNMIKNVINKRANEISPSEDMFKKINTQINLNKENVYMNFKMKKSIRSIGLACCMLILVSVTAYASVNYLRGGYSKNAFTSFPSETQVKQAVHFIPSYVERFENGYTFTSAMVGESQVMDSQENVVLSANTIEFKYSKKDAEGLIHIQAEQIVKGINTLADAEGEKVSISDSISGIYISYMSKHVPENYELTAQDKIDQENGTYVFSFGEDTFSVNHVQYVAWKQDNIAYYIASYADEVTQAEMLEMAAEIVNK